MAINCIDSINSHCIPEFTWKTLHRADSTSLGPFQLLLSDANERLHCHEIVRIIPGKRLVAFGYWGEKEVVAKLFYGRGKAKQHLRRDSAGIQALMQANVPTPRLLYHGSAVDQRIQIALFDKIAQAKNLEEIWQEQKNTDEFLQLMQQVIVELATQHVLGILQRDLHLKNFLVAGQRIFTLDGGSIEVCDAILDKNQSMDNLSLLFAQLGVGTECLQRALFETYAKSRGWIIKRADFDLLKKEVAKKSKERWQRYKKKIARTCTAFVKKTQWNRVIVYSREYQSPTLLHFLSDPEKFFTHPKVTYLKKGRSASVVKIKVDDRLLVIKRYNMKNGWHWLRRCLRSTRAATSWRLAQYLYLFGVSTVKPVAYVESRFCLLRGTSYFVMEHIGGQNIGEFFSGCTNEAHYDKIANDIVSLLNKLSELKVTHGDLKITNILFENGCPTLIDLDGMRHHVTKFGFNRAIKKEIARFKRNWDDNPKAAALFNVLLNH